MEIKHSPQPPLLGQLLFLDPPQPLVLNRQLKCLEVSDSLQHRYLAKLAALIKEESVVSSVCVRSLSTTVNKINNCNIQEPFLTIFRLLLILIFHD